MPLQPGSVTMTETATMPAPADHLEHGEPARDHWSDSVRPSDLHRRRRAAILALRPEVRELSGACPKVAALAAALVAVQCAVAVAVADAPVMYAIAAAVFVGAFVAHFLNVVIHEAAHNLVFTGTAKNKAVAILANLPLLIPAAIAFRHFHLLHHDFLGEERMDGDLALS
jgi:sphingolipid 4-desaturase/C4-monooxygenase